MARQKRVEAVDVQGDIHDVDMHEIPEEVQERQPPAPEQPPAVVREGDCAKCGRPMAVVSERMVNNGIVRQYRCPICKELVTV